MTAQEAKKLTEESKKIMDQINIAAFEGKSKITVFSLSTIVYEGLKTLGYSIKSIEGGINETNYEISW